MSDEKVYLPKQVTNRGEAGYFDPDGNIEVVEPEKLRYADSESTDIVGAPKSGRGRKGSEEPPADEQQPADEGK